MLLFIDGFDHYSAAQLQALRKHDGTNNPGQFSISSTTTRYGYGAYMTQNNNVGGNIYKDLTASSTLIVGFAHRIPDYQGNTKLIVALASGGTTQVDLRINTSGQLIITRNGTTLATSTLTITHPTWVYIEMKVTFSTTVGAYEVRVNGDVFLQASGVNTSATGGTTANRIYLLSPIINSTGGVITQHMDDLYVCNDTGGVNDDFLGDVRVVALFPNGNGNSSDMVGSDGNSTDNYLLVDESNPNDDTDYVVTSTPGDHDTYAMGNLPTLATAVFGTQELSYSRKSDAGFRKLRNVIRTGGTDYESADLTVLDAYNFLENIRDVNPNTSAQWTPSEIDAIEAGQKLQS
jgi:hypothetical protein